MLGIRQIGACKAAAWNKGLTVIATNLARFVRFLTSQDSLQSFLPDAASRRHGIGLCWSGGGFRAALFHLGALRRLNELGILSKIDRGKRRANFCADRVTAFRRASPSTTARGAASLSGETSNCVKRTRFRLAAQS